MTTSRPIWCIIIILSWVSLIGRDMWGLIL